MARKTKTVTIGGESYEVPRVPRKLKAFVIIGVALLILWKIGPWNVVPTGHVGVQRWWQGLSAPFGVEYSTLEQGFNFPVVATDVIHIPVRGQTRTINVDDEHDDAAVTQDRQSIGGSFNIGFRYSRSRVQAAITHLGTEPSAWFDEYMIPEFVESMKSVLQNRTLRDNLDERDQVSNEIEDLFIRQLNRRLEKTGDGLVPVSPEAGESAIVITSVAIENFNWDEDLSNEIEATMLANQQRLTAEEQLEVQRIQHQQQAAQAEGEAAANIARAQGEAEANIERARGVAEANVIQARGEAEAEIERGRGTALKNLQVYESEIQYLMSQVALGLDPNYLQFAESWEGAFPQYLFGDAEGLWTIIPRGDNGQFDVDRMSLLMQQMADRREELSEVGAAPPEALLPMAAELATTQE